MAENLSKRLRNIDESLLELGLAERATRLNQFLGKSLKSYGDEIARQHRHCSGEQNDLTAQFGDWLAQMTKEYLADERKYKLHTHWNRPEEEEEVCLRTAQLGKTYCAAPKHLRDEVVRQCLDSFVHLPMPIEEIADEERVLSRQESKEKAEDLRPWYKIEKSAHVIDLEGALFDPPLQIRRRQKGPAQWRHLEQLDQFK